MNNFKKIIALLSAVAVALSCAACHPKGEIAATAKDAKSGASVDITTAQYLYAMTNAVMEAQSLIDEENSDKEIEDYSKYKVVETDENGKEVKTKYEKWIAEKRDAILLEYAGSMAKKEALKLKLDDSSISTAEQMASLYWQYYGYQTLFEKNGVSLETYTDMFMSTYYKNEYFLSIYDTEGTDPVDEKTVKKEFYDNYTLANAIVIDTASEDAEEEDNEEHDHAEGETEEEAKPTVAEAKKVLKAYKERVEKGESFEKVYKEHMSSTATDEETETDTSAMPVVYASAETGEDAEHFETIYKMKKGALKILVNDDESQVILVQKQDISKNEKADDSYYKSYRENVLYMIKGEEFEEGFQKYYEDLKFETTSAAKRLKFDKIDVEVEQ